MPETTRTLLNSCAIAGGVAMAVGVFVACATYPIVLWWSERRSAKIAGERQSGPLSSAPLPGVVPEPDFDGDYAPAVDRLVGGHQP